MGVTLRDGRQMRVQLPFAPASPLPKLALDALAAVLPPASWFLLFSCQLAAPGKASATCMTSSKVCRYRCGCSKAVSSCC